MSVAHDIILSRAVSQTLKHHISRNSETVLFYHTLIYSMQNPWYIIYLYIYLLGKNLAKTILIDKESDGGSSNICSRSTHRSYPLSAFDERQYRFFHS